MNMVKEKILSLLQEKQRIFLEIEKISEKMFSLEVDELIEAVGQRQELLDEVQNLDSEIRRCCDEQPDIRPLLNHTQLANTQEEKMFYDLSLEIKATANRIMQGEEEREKYMKLKKQEIKEKIEKLNSTGQVTAKRYHQVIAAGIEEANKKFSRNF